MPRAASHGPPLLPSPYSCSNIVRQSRIETLRSGGGRARRGALINSPHRWARSGNSTGCAASYRGFSNAASSGAKMHAGPTVGDQDMQACMKYTCETDVVKPMHADLGSVVPLICSVARKPSDRRFRRCLHVCIVLSTKVARISDTMTGSGVLPANLPPNEDKTLLPVAVAAVFTPIALFIVLFRLTARWKGNGFKADDYCMIAAMVTCPLRA